MARKMKTSGIEWIGNIPTNWDIVRMKSCIASRDGGAWGNEPKGDDCDLICLRIADFDYSRFIFKDLEEEEYTKRNYNKSQVDKLVLQENDILIEKSGGGEKTPVGRTVLFNKSFRALFANFMDRLRCSDVVNPKFMQYVFVLFYNNGYTKNYIKQTTGIQNLDLTSMLANENLAIPPREEQKKIAIFLDEKCAAIDSVIEKTRESIKGYRNLKQAVITDAVTKGVREIYSNQMSDNAWFSEIPSNWEMRKLKYLFSIKKNIAGKEGYTVLSITQNGIVPKNISKNEGQLAQDYSNYQLVEIGDFAMNHMDLLTGWVDISKYDGVTSPDYRVFVLNDKENNSPEYYLRFMQMCYFNKIFYGLGQGVSGLGRWRLQADKFLNFVVPVPPLEEQLEIAEYLDMKCTEIDNIISKKEQYLVELESYKKSLIYEYVTGKKEVIEDVQVEEAVDYPYFPAKYNAKSPRFAQAILMSKILDENCDNMGRVKLEKTLYTIENSIGFDFDTEYVRDVAGPFDSSIYDCEGIVSRKNKWFVIDETGRGVSYNTTEKKDTYKKYYMKYFSEYDAEIQRIIELFSDYTTDKAEIIATLFASWNDAIIDNKNFTDEDIVNDVLNNWHDKKKRFSKDIWINAMVEMRENNLVPKGYGKHTVKKGER